MKFKFFFAIAAVMAIAFIKPALGFTQTPVQVRDIADDLKEFSDDMSGALPFIASMGLLWADSYIGQLIDITPHWGIGIAAGATTLKLDKLNVLLENFGYEADDGFMDKQLLPAYVLNVRLGGFRTAPFDIGVKWGWLPYMPIFKNNISYEAVIYGLDFRWEVVPDWGYRPSMSVGLEVNRATGGLSSKSSQTLEVNGPVQIVTSGGATIGPVWEAWVFDAKLQIARKFWEPRFTASGGVRAGVALVKTGYRIAGTGSDIKIIGSTTFNLEDLGEKDRYTFTGILDTASGNGMAFELTDKDITGWIDSIGINLNLHGGFGLDFDNGLRLDLALMVDLMHIELGANIGFRYQQ